MEKLDLDLLQRVQRNFGKQAFVPMAGGAGEPVAGASQATAGMTQPMGAPQGGGMPPQGGGMPPQGGGMPPQGGAPQGQDPSQMPPELQEALQDPQIQQLLQQAGFAMDPNTGMVMDPATGQPVPPDQLMQILQQLIQGAQSGAMPGQGGQPGQEGGQPGGEQQQDPMQQIIQLHKDISVKLDKGATGKAEGKEKKMSVDEKIDGMGQQIQRLTEMLGGLTGQQ